MPACSMSFFCFVFVDGGIVLGAGRMAACFSVVRDCTSARCHVHFRTVPCVLLYSALDVCTVLHGLALSQRAQTCI